MKNAALKAYVYGSAAIGLALCVGLAFTILLKAAPAMSIAFLTSASTKGGSAGGVYFQTIGSLVLSLTALPCMAVLSVTLSMWRFQRFQTQNRIGFFESVFDMLLKASHSVPSVAWGLVGFLFFVRFGHLGKSWLAGGMTLALVGTPFVVEACLASLRSIPFEAHVTANSLGLSKERLIKSLYLPYAYFGALAGLRIAIPRILGETAPILLTACVFSGVTLPTGIQDAPVLSLPYHLYVLSQESFSQSALQNAWGAGLVIILLGTMANILLRALSKIVFKETLLETRS
jgi:phosphate transport system permease protein